MGQSTIPRQSAYVLLGLGLIWNQGRNMSRLCLGNWHHTGKATWEQRWVCLGWYPGNGCLLRSIGVSCKEKGLLLGTLLWHKVGVKLFWLDLELWLPHQPSTATVAQWGWVRLPTAPQPHSCTARSRDEGSCGVAWEAEHPGKVAAQL